MKRINNKFLFFLILITAQNSYSQLNEKLEDYFSSVYINEKSKFLDCVKLEGLQKLEKINTLCEISQPLKDAAYILYGIKNTHKSSLLDNFTKYKPLKKQTPFYPASMLGLGMMGYVVVEYDITSNGKTTNHNVIESMCGDPTNPKTHYSSCNFFNGSALKAAKKLEYKPATYKKTPINTKRAKHKFTYIMEPPFEEVDSGNQAYRQLLKSIKDNDLKKSLSIANKNLQRDPLFTYQKARIACIQDRHADCINLLGDFDNKILEKDKQVSEIIHVTSFTMLVYALFNLNRYDEIIELEEFYLPYALEQKNYKAALAITNLYIAAAYINLGNLQKGVYYMAIASKNTSSDSEKEFIDSFIEKISSYL
jgi:hypothetical protein